MQDGGIGRSSSGQLGSDRGNPRQCLPRSEASRKLPGQSRPAVSQIDPRVAKLG